MSILRGVLTFHSETGTEGGYWAFQDERFITPNTTHFYCTHCGLPWDRSKESDEYVFKKGEEFESKYGGQPGIDGRPKHYCSRDAHEFKKTSEENWSYAGLHILKDGDHLTIYSKENSTEVVWDGTIQIRQFELFTEHVFSMWIHADQVGVNRETWAKWFLRGYPAELSTLDGK